MNLDDQLSLNEAPKNARDVSAQSKTSQSSFNAQNSELSGNLSYADIKGRVSLPQTDQVPNSPTRRTAPPKPITVPHGYDDPSTEGERYLAVKQVANRYSVSVPTIWRWSKEDEAFPKPRVIRKGTSRWRLSELLAFENRNPEA